MHVHTSSSSSICSPFPSPSPRLHGATEGYEQGVMRGRGPPCPGRRGDNDPRFCDLCCLLSKPRQRLLSHYPWLQPPFIQRLHVKHTNTHAHTHTLTHTLTQTLLRPSLTLLLNTVILCLVMGTGSSVPRVPLDNWLLLHLLTSPPLTFLHFTFKVLHFSPPAHLVLLPPPTRNTRSCVPFFLVLILHCRSQSSSAKKFNPTFQTYLWVTLILIDVTGFSFFCTRMNGIKFWTYMQ